MRPALPVLLLAMLLVTAGCLGGVFGPSRPPSDERALDGRAEATGDDDSPSVDLSGSGAANVTRRRLNATTRARGTARSSYVDGHTAYTECARIGWARENLTRSAPWVDYTPLGQQLEVLDRSNVYWRGTRTVDGTETGRFLRTRSEIRVARRGATATATLRFTDYGEPVEVERPSFDEDALWETGCPEA